MRHLRWMGQLARRTRLTDAPPKVRPGLFRNHAWMLLVLFIGVLTLVLPCLYGCGSDTESAIKQMVRAEEGATLTSSNGKVTLEIPAGALGEDTEISLSLIPEEDWTDDTRAWEPVGSVYRLEPDGLELLKPATLTFRLEAADLADLGLPEGTFPVCDLLISSGDGSWDFLGNLAATADADTGEMLVRGEAVHFSMAFMREDGIVMSLSPRSVERYVAEQWNGTVLIQNYSRNRGVIHIVYMEQRNVGCVISVNPGHNDYIGTDISLNYGVTMETDEPILWTCSEGGKGHYGVGAWIYRWRTQSDWERMHPDSREPIPDSEVKYGFYLQVWGTATCHLPTTTSLPQGGTTTTAASNSLPSRELSFSPDPCDFGEVVVGGRKFITVKVTNTGELDAAISGYTWPGAPFDVISTRPRGLTLKVGESYVYTIEFSPPAAEDYISLFGIGARFSHEGQTYQGKYHVDLDGTGVVSPPTKVGSLSIKGDWDLYAAGDQVQLDFQMQVSVAGGSPDDFHITRINYYRDDLETPKWSSDSLETKTFPSGAQPWIFRSFVDPGVHTARVEAFSSDGQRFVRTWEIDCQVEPGEESSTTTKPSTVEQKVVCGLSFAHVAPGEYSEVYADISGPPGSSVDVTLSGPGVVSTARQTGTLSAAGTLRLTWRINQYGGYSVSGTVGGTPVGASVQVQ